jgi:hypothetical protein
MKFHPLDSLGVPQTDLFSLDIETWLDLPVAGNSRLTIRTLIRRVCDLDDGAHVDIKPLAGSPANRETRQ